MWEQRAPFIALRAGVPRMPADATTLGHMSAENGLRLVAARSAQALRPCPIEVRLNLLGAGDDHGEPLALAHAPERAGGGE
eukprot:14932495-Alexandrium_andersonii.AAC.1